MSEQPLPPKDLFVRDFQFTETVHRDAYDGISPTLPEHSQAKKTVIITGASQGIGRAIALAFAEASAANLVLFARNKSGLEETASQVSRVPNAPNVVCVAGDVTSESDVKRLEDTVREKFQSADVCVNCAGQWLSRGPIQEVAVGGWWKDIEVNVKGTYLVTGAFLRLVQPKSEAKPTVVNVSSFGSALVVPGCSSYALSKTAINRLTEYIAAENPHVTAIAYHPGSVPTAILDTHKDFGHFALDTPELAGRVAVYLASPRAVWLNGRYMACNWDVNELEQRKDEVLKKDLLKLVLKGEFGPGTFRL